MPIRTVQTGRPYDVMVDSGLLAQCGALCREVNSGDKALLVSDTNVTPLYAENVMNSLQQAGYEVALFTFPAGEQSKTLNTVSDIYAALAKAGLTRADLLVALGGGVTGDITGFAASTWLRGVDVIQIPTSLLAQVDSSVGGKTGVDIPTGKNLVGAFWQPKRVIVDTDTLRTLPDAFWKDGMGEVIKTACIKDADLFRRLARNKLLTPATAASAIFTCIDIKAGVVERDERESGERKLLNFGHTYGHALERYYHFKGLSHGCAVAVGMTVITRASEKAGLTPIGTADKLEAVLTRYGLPTTDNAFVSKVLPFTLKEKKRRTDDVELVLLSSIGHSVVHAVTLKELPTFFGLL